MKMTFTSEDMEAALKLLMADKGVNMYDHELADFNYTMTRTPSSTLTVTADLVSYEANEEERLVERLAALEEFNTEANRRSGKTARQLLTEASANEVVTDAFHAIAVLSEAEMQVIGEDNSTEGTDDVEHGDTVKAESETEEAKEEAGTVQEAEESTAYAEPEETVEVEEEDTQEEEETVTEAEQTVTSRPSPFGKRVVPV